MLIHGKEMAFFLSVLKWPLEGVNSLRALTAMTPTADSGFEK
jgi:hypothetical protein